MNPDIVTIFNENGLEIGKKPRKELDKQKDIFQAVYVRVFIGDKMLLTKVVKKEGGIVKTNEGKWGLPVATILRDGESSQDAFERACTSDIGVIPKITQTYDKKLINFESTSPRIVFSYDAILGSVPKNTDVEYVLVDISELKSMYEKGILAETAFVPEGL